MATTTVTVGLPSIAAEIRQAYSMQLLVAVRPLLVHHQFAEKKPIPLNIGQTLNMRRFELLSPVVTPLVEGVTPNGNTLTITNVAVTLAQYGDFVQFSDVVELVSIDPILHGITDIQAQEAGNSLDIIARDVFCAGSTVRYANGATSRATVGQAGPATISGVEIKKAVRQLAINNASRFDQYYAAVVHPSTSYDIMNITEWINAREYSDPKDLYDGELGQLYGVRFVQTTNAVIFSGQGYGGIDVYGTLFFGKMAVMTTELAGNAMKSIIKPVGASGTEDPLDQRGSAGYAQAMAYAYA